MQMSGEYGTELLIRYNEQQLLRDLERRRVSNERRAEAQAAKREAGSAILARLTALFGPHTERMPRRTTGVSQVHAAHR